MSRLSLVQKISLLLGLLGLAGGLIISLLLYSTVDRFEDVLLNQSTESQLDLRLQIHERYPGLQWGEGQSPRFYHFTAETRESLPDALRTLRTGRHHEVEIGGRLHHVLIRQSGDDYFAVAQDIDELEFVEDVASVSYLLALVLTLAIFLLMLWATRKVVDPVTQLAAEVESMQPDDPLHALSERYREGEVHTIAAALDGFQEKLTSFVERERTFTAAASHELRTPLAVIASSSELLQSMPGVSDTARQVSQRIDRSVRQMQDMITSLLFLARESTSPRSGLARPRVNLSRIVSEVLTDHQSLMQGQAIPICEEVQGDVFVEADESHVRMILNNLLRNATSHTSQGSVTTTLTTKELIVSDTGTGIAPELLARVFQRDVSDWQSQGLGFGLYLCKQLADRYGWSLVIDSTPNKGTSVHLQFDV